MFLRVKEIKYIFTRKFHNSQFFVKSKESIIYTHMYLISGEAVTQRCLDSTCAGSIKLKSKCLELNNNYSPKIHKIFTPDRPRLTLPSIPDSLVFMM